MKKFNSTLRVAVGRVAAQVFAVGGARAAYNYSHEVGRADLGEKIAQGEFAPPLGFGPKEAQARAHALVWLARYQKRVA